MKRLRLLCAMLCIAGTAQAQTVWIINHADSSGFTVADPDHYREQMGTCTRLDSALAVFDALVATLPRTEARDDAVVLTANGTWSIYLDVDGFLPPDESLFTNANEDGAGCPRTFISADVLLDPRSSDCLKRALLLHEWRHVRDFIAGRVPPFILTQTATETFQQDLELLEFEYRAYREEIYASYTGGCGDSDGWYRSYRQGGLPQLRWTIAVTYGLLERHPRQKATIWNACKWVPWDP